MICPASFEVFIIIDWFSLFLDRDSTSPGLVLLCLTMLPALGLQGISTDLSPCSLELSGRFTIVPIAFGSFLGSCSHF